MKITLYLFFCIVVMMSPAKAQIITTFAGNGSSGYTGNGGAANTATLDSPNCLAIDRAGNIFFTDQINNCIRKVDTFGTITTVAGTGIFGDSIDGIPATNAKLSQVWGVAVDVSGAVYITDQNNYKVKRVSTLGIITTIAGTGDTGVTGDNGPAYLARFKRPIGIAIDNSGNIFIGDQDANVIKKINPSGIISTYAGIVRSYGYNGDGGQATAALLAHPFGLATDVAGNLYIADAENNRIRKVSTSGIITTVAGNGFAGAGGDGSPAVACNLSHPTSMFMDVAGNLFIADYLNNRIRKVDPAGIIHTVAGTGAMGFNGDGGLCTAAKFSGPTTVVGDNRQNLYVADYSNNRIRKIKMVLKFNAHRNQFASICQNTTISLNNLLTARDLSIGFTDTWSVLSPPAYGIANVTYSALATGADVTPTGLYYTPGINYVGDDSIRVLVANSIATDTITIYVTVDPFINNAGTITGDSAVCVGATILLTDTASGGLWTISNLNAIVAGGLVTGELAGSDTVTYRVTNSCGSASTSKVITVNPVPFMGEITGAETLCPGTAVTLIDTVSGGYWSKTNGNASLYTAATACLVTGLLPGKDTILYTVADSLCSASAVEVVLIDALPAATIDGGIQQLCMGATINITGTPTGGIWNLSNDVASFEQDVDGGILTALGAGNDTLIYSVTNFCGTATAVCPFETDTLPAKPTIIRNENILHAPRGYAAYQWIYNGMPLAGATADSFLLTKEGQYAVTVTNRFGCFATADAINFAGCSPGDIIIFPNPSENLFHIIWCRKLTARLMCMDGRQVKTVYDTNEIDMENLPNADYMIAFYDEDGKKLLVKRITKLTK